MNLRKIFLMSFLVVISLVVFGFIFLRNVGIPCGPIIVVEHTTFKGRLLDLTLRYIGGRRAIYYPNGKIAARSLFRESEDYDLIIWARCYDPEGNLRSRIDSGNGFIFTFYSNGVPKELIGYLNGIPCGPYFTWKSDGNLKYVEYHDRNGNHHWVYDCTCKSK
jgi:hypothetical protein